MSLALSQIEHQARAISLIRRALRSGRTHHAYLFDGPDGVGKELAGRALAARLLCQADAPDAPLLGPAQRLAPDADACGACSSCKLMAGDNHPDFHLIHRGLHKVHPEPNVRKSKGLFLAVDVIRHFLIEKAVLSPTQGRARVFLVRDAERMNEGAQNALLKTLEEPPGHTRLILVTSSASRLLPTIRSRSQRVPFGPLPADFVAARLAAAGIEAATAQTLARLSDGRLGAALRWHALKLPEAVDGVLGLLRAAPAGDPETFAKRILEIADGLARRSVQLARGVAAEEDDSSEEDADAAYSDDDESAAERPAAGRAAGKSVATDELRAALRLALMVVAAAFRDALALGRDPPGAMQAGGGVSERATFPHHQNVTRALPAAGFVEPAACIEAVAVAEMMLERNVAPQLALERLAAALTGTAAPSAA